MTITNWKTSSGKRLGTFNLLTPSGFTFIGCSVVNGEKGMFIGLPQRDYMQGDVKKYVAVVKIEDPERAQKFNDAVLEALGAAGYLGGNQGGW